MRWLKCFFQTMASGGRTDKLPMFTKLQIFSKFPDKLIPKADKLRLAPQKATVANCDGGRQATGDIAPCSALCA
jgi:hypothetical protein